MKLFVGDPIRISDASMPTVSDGFHGVITGIERPGDGRTVVHFLTKDRSDECVVKCDKQWWMYERVVRVSKCDQSVSI